MSGPVNRWQQVLHDLCFHVDTVNPKVLAYHLHKARNFISDVCSRDRVDPFPIFNQILRYAEETMRHCPQKAINVVGPIADLLTTGTNWHLSFTPPDSDVDYQKLCERAGSLCTTLGGTIESLARIEDDGVVDKSDDPEIASCLAKIDVLEIDLRQLRTELLRRRHAEAVS